MMSAIDPTVRAGPEPGATVDGPAGFEPWYRAVHPRVVATLALATGDWDDAADAADEAMTRALERWDRVSRMDRPDGWVYRVAFNVLRSRGRRRAVERRLLHRLAPVATVVPEPAGEAWEVVRNLPRRQREVVVLRYLADLPRAEIGRVLGISEGTVGSTLFDANRALRPLLGDEETGEQP
jgi:RNA polymerase sigma factor (sigma-70 family)